MNSAELSAFRDRCHRAAVRGYAIAHSALYTAAMEKEAGDVEPPLGSAKGSAAHLAALAQAVLEVRAGTGKKAKKKAAPPPPKASKPKAPAPKPKAPEPEPEDEPEDDEVPYEEWDYKELYAVAQECNIPGRSNMGKDELITALYAWDEEHSE